MSPATSGVARAPPGFAIPARRRRSERGNWSGSSYGLWGLLSRGSWRLAVAGGESSTGAEGRRQWRGGGSEQRQRRRGSGGCKRAKEAREAPAPRAAPFMRGWPAGRGSRPLPDVTARGGRRWQSRVSGGEALYAAVLPHGAPSAEETFPRCWQSGHGAPGGVSVAGATVPAGRRRGVALWRDVARAGVLWLPPFLLTSLLTIKLKEF